MRVSGSHIITTLMNDSFSGQSPHHHHCFVLLCPSSSVLRSRSLAFRTNFQSAPKDSCLSCQCYHPSVSSRPARPELRKKYYTRVRVGASLCYVDLVTKMGPGSLSDNSCVRFCPYMPSYSAVSPQLSASVSIYTLSVCACKPRLGTCNYNVGRLMFGNFSYYRTACVTGICALHRQLDR